MKKKIVSAKLSLKKKVITPLSIDGSNQVIGGATGPQSRCAQTCGPVGCEQTLFDPSVCICPATQPCTTIPGTQAC